MSKQGMKRPEINDGKPKNTVPPVPEIQGRAKSGKEKARPIIAGTSSPAQKVWHSKSFSYADEHYEEDASERPISDVYPEIDNDLARDNIENDLTDADLQDL